MQLLAQLLSHGRRIGALAIELVDESDTRDFVALHLAVDGDALGLDAGDSAEYQDGTI